MPARSRVYVALGDSTGVGVGARDGRGYVVRLLALMHARDPSVQLLNLCVSGATAPDVASRQLPRALKAAPSLCTLFIGTNDVLWGSERSFKQSMSLCSSTLREQGIRTLLCTLPNLTHAPLAGSHQVALHSAGLARKLTAYNEQIRELAARDQHELLDLFAVGLADSPHFFSPDGFHPSADGYEALAGLLWRQMEPLMER